MWKRFSRVALSFLLSASVLAWGTMPPAIHHAHHGSSARDHCHDTVVVAAKHDLNHGHHHNHDGSDHRHEDVDVTAPTALGDFVVHLHWMLCGLDFCMPAPPEDEHDEDDGATRLALIRLIDELPTVSPRGYHSRGAPMIAPPVLGPHRVAVEVSPSHPPNRIASIPLCDSARFERSGVLLA